MSKKKFKEEFLKNIDPRLSRPEIKIGLRTIDLEKPRPPEPQSASDGTLLDVRFDTPPLPYAEMYERPAPKKPFFKKPLFWSMSLVVLAASFFALAGLNVYAQSRRELQEKNIADCKSLIQEAQRKGIDTQNLQCEMPQGLLDMFWDTQTQSQLENTRRTLAERESDLRSRIEAQDKLIQNLKSDLSDLQVDLDKESADGVQNSAVFDETDLAKQLQQKQDYAGNLAGFRDKNVTIIKETIDSFDKIMQVNPDLDFSAEKPALERYRGLDQAGQIKGFKDFLALYAKLQDKVASAKPTGRRTVSPAELAKYKVFTATQFQDLYARLQYDKVNPATDPSPSITGDADADKRIISIAEKRGYKRRSEAVASGLVGAEGQTMQTQTRDAWNLMKQAASREGISLGLVSGFRSVDLQRTIFRDALQQVSVQKTGRAYSNAEIAAGKADDAINAVLDTRSIPGYSKHHTGYTIDITDSDSGMQFTAFRNTPAFDWISANNYYNAKRFGFIPSYPTGGTNFGPEPEAWEYVWVGESQLLA